jgi:predicted acetyltransferase
MTALLPATRLVTPTALQLDAYRAALRRGWCANTLAGGEGAAKELAELDADPAAFLALMDDPLARAGPITLPDGSSVARIPARRFWIWTGDDDSAASGFAGSIGLRWPADLGALPPHVLGHIGYSIVPWQRQQGHATRALGLLLPHAWALGLREVEITTDVDNLASQRVITANGGVFSGVFDKGAVWGHKPGHHYRIAAPGVGAG